MPTIRRRADMDPILDDLEGRLGVQFNDRSLLLSAITHRSFWNDNRWADWDNNERLEFLGDAVLEICVTAHLFFKFPKLGEGGLTNYRVALVCGASLAEIAETLNLDAYMLMSRGQLDDARQNPKSRRYIMANAVEAILGAVYVDQGIGTCRMIVDFWFLNRMTRLIENRRCFKSDLQERVQAEGKLNPTYQLLHQEGPDHAKTFTVGVYIEGAQAAIGRGGSKKEAEIAAAKAALEQLGL